MSEPVSAPVAAAVTPPLAVATPVWFETDMSPDSWMTIGILCLQPEWRLETIALTCRHDEQDAAEYYVRRLLGKLAREFPPTKHARVVHLIITTSDQQRRLPTLDAFGHDGDDHAEEQRQTDHKKREDGKTSLTTDIVVERQTLAYEECLMRALTGAKEGLVVVLNKKPIEFLTLDGNEGALRLLGSAAIVFAFIDDDEFKTLASKQRGALFAAFSRCKRVVATSRFLALSGTARNRFPHQIDEKTPNELWKLWDENVTKSPAAFCGALAEWARVWYAADTDRATSMVISLTKRHTSMMTGSGAGAGAGATGVAGTAEGKQSDDETAVDREQTDMLRLVGDTDTRRFPMRSQLLAFMICREHSVTVKPCKYKSNTDGSFGIVSDGVLGSEEKLLTSTAVAQEFLPARVTAFLLTNLRQLAPMVSTSLPEIDTGGAGAGGPGGPSAADRSAADEDEDASAATMDNDEAMRVALAMATGAAVSTGAALPPVPMFVDVLPDPPGATFVLAGTIEEKKDVGPATTPVAAAAVAPADAAATATLRPENVQAAPSPPPSAPRTLSQLSQRRALPPPRTPETAIARPPLRPRPLPSARRACCCRCIKTLMITLLLVGCLVAVTSFIGRTLTTERF